MINRIKGIRLKGANFVNETDLHLFQSSSNKVTKMALIYGRNGSGKSTISNAFKIVKGECIENIEKASLYDNNEHEIPMNDEGNKKIFIYNEEFVNDKVKIKEEGLGSIIMLGEKADLTVKIEKVAKELLEAEERLASIKNRTSEYRDSRNLISPFYYVDKMNSTLKKDEGWAGRERRIKNNRRNANVSERKYEDFVGLPVTKTINELLINFENEMTQLDEAKKGTGRVVDNIIKVPIKYKKFDYESIEKLLMKSIEKPVLSEREEYLLYLAENGNKVTLQHRLDHFSDDKITYCPFCLQDISTDYKANLVEKVQSILSDEVEEHCRQLSAYLVDEFDFDFTSFSKLKSWKKCSDLLNRLNEIIQKNNNIINQKIGSPYIGINEKFSDMTVLIGELEAILVTLEQEKEEYNKSIVNTEPIIERLININNELACCEIKTDHDNYKKQYNKYNEILKEENEANELVKKLKLLREELENQRKNIVIAVDFINKGLKYVFFSEDRLKIVVENGRYRVLSNGKHVLPNNISVGERNIIGLCYFFASILQEKDSQDGFKDECLIVIDDPISSFDFENRIGILSFLKLKLSQILNANLDSKAVIFTHDLLTFFDVEKIFEELLNEFKSSFVDTKITFNLMELFKCSLRDFQYKNRHEYTEMMKLVYDYATNKSFDNSILIGNVMRQVLEAFATFEYKKGISEISTDKNVLDRVGVEYREYFKNLMYRLVLNGGSHREEMTRSGRLDFFSVISLEEKVRTAKDILCFMYLINDLHVIAHLGDVRPDLIAWCNEIKNR